MVLEQPKKGFITPPVRKKVGEKATSGMLVSVSREAGEKTKPAAAVSALIICGAGKYGGRALSESA